MKKSKFQISNNYDYEWCHYECFTKQANQVYVLGLLTPSMFMFKTVCTRDTIRKNSWTIVIKALTTLSPLSAVATTSYACDSVLYHAEIFIGTQYKGILSFLH